MDDPNIPPNTFPPMLSPPKVEPRARAQTPEFDELDMSYREFYDESPLNGPIPQAHLDSPRCQDALKKLEDHVSNRLPYVLLASARLHEASGVQNQLPFVIPDIQLCSLPGSAAFHSRIFAADGCGYGAGPSRGHSWLMKFYRGHHANGFSGGIRPSTAQGAQGASSYEQALGSGSTADHGRGTPVAGHSLLVSQFMVAESDNSIENDSTVRHGNSFNAVSYGSSIGQDTSIRQGGPSVSAATPPRPLTTPSVWANPLLSHAVDTSNGAGLRTFLTRMGKEQGQYKLDCKSISFHDLTPDFRTNLHSNVLLKHIAARGLKERITCYEVDLPIEIPTENGTTRSTDRWIYLLVQRPIVGLPPNSVYSRDPTPPNFPKSMGYSWVVFAAPLSHVTDYGVGIEEVVHKEELIERYHYPPELAPGTKRVSKRRDFDFSQAGIPIFEFSNVTSPNPMLLPLQFVSVDRMPIFESIGSDGYMPWSDETYDIIKRSFTRDVLGGEDGASRHDGEFGPEIPCPYQGKWWELFYTRMYEEARSWSSIKGAMGRGNCHIVLRWDDFEIDEEIAEAESTGMARQQVTRNAHPRERRGLASMGARADGSGSGSGQLSSMGTRVGGGGSSSVIGQTSSAGIPAGARRSHIMSHGPMAEASRSYVLTPITPVPGLGAEQEGGSKDTGKGKEIMK